MLTAERLRELLKYDAETGLFIFLRRQGYRAAGAVAGSYDRDGYRRITVDKKEYRAARLAWLYMTGEFPAHTVDHINGIRDDDRFSNLRLADDCQNRWNSGRYTTKQYDAPKGAYYHKKTGRWLSTIGHRGQYTHLGSFETAEEAHEAYKRAAERLHGEFARVI